MTQNNYLVENAKVMAKGQITLPKDIRKALGIDVGSRVALVFDGERVIMMNAAVYAMRMFQNDMAGEWEKAGIHSDEDVIDLVSEVRKEIEGL